MSESGAGAYRAENDEVLYTRDPLTVVSRENIDALKCIAAGNPRKRSRLCSHDAPSNSLHEMLIVHERNAYVRPHRHPGKSESTHIIEGAVDVVMFDEQGGVTEVVKMGDYSSGRPFYYRMAAPIFHTLIIRSDVLVFHETTNGPFDRTKTEFAEWSPPDGDEQAAAEFMSGLQDKINRL